MDVKRVETGSGRILKKIYAAGYRQIEPCLGVRGAMPETTVSGPGGSGAGDAAIGKYHIEVRAVHIFLDEYHYEREFAILAELAQKYHISWFVVKSPARLAKDVLTKPR